MSVANRESRVVGASGVNLNAVVNQGLLEFVANKPITIQRFAVIANAAQGLLAPMVLRLRIRKIRVGFSVDLGTDLLNGAALAEGFGIYKDITAPLRIDAGDSVFIAIAVPAGGVSTGNVSLEYWELPFSGAEITPQFIASL